MNKNLIFIKDNNDTILYYLSFIPLLIYGLYKNGYLLYTNHFINALDVFKILIYPFGSLLIGIIFSIIFKKRVKHVISFALLMGVSAPYNFNIYLYLVFVLSVMFIAAFLPNKYKINEAAFLISALIVLNRFSPHYSMYNPMEFLNSYKYSLMDLFFGRGPSYLFTSSIFFLIISFLTLSFIKTYKKNIPIIEIFVFIFLVCVYMLATHSYLSNIKLLLNGTTFFSFIYLSTINESSPSTKYTLYIYSVLIAVLSFILVYIFDIYTGSVIAIFIISLFYRLYELFRQRLLLKCNCS